MSLLITVLVGCAIGYFFKPIVVEVVSCVLLVFIGLSIGYLMAVSDHSLGDILPLAVILLGSVVLASMWITHFVKHAGGVMACLRSIGKKTLDR